jgi:glutathione S-transferase
MKLYHTVTSPYGRLARIIVIERGLQSRIELLEAKTRTTDSPYYQVNPSGRVPFLVRDDGGTMEDSQLIARYLDQLDGAPRLHVPFEQEDWTYGRLESYARSMVDGLSVHVREIRRPENERSPTVIRHETDRAIRLADHWERELAHPLMNGPLNMAQLLLIVALDLAASSKIADLEGGRARLTAWAKRMREVPSVHATAAKPT